MPLLARALCCVTLSSLALPAFAYECHTAHERPGARHDVCRFTPEDGMGEARNLHLLHLKGKTADTAYYHGLFLAPEIQSTSLPRVLEEIDGGIATFPEAQRPIIKAIAECQLNRYRSSVSQEFLDLHKNLERGLREAGNRSLGYDALLRGSFAVELSIYFDGLAKKLHDNAFGTAVEIAGECGLQIPFHLLNDLVNSLVNRMPKVKMGCTGIAASGPTTREGQLIHSRNFDSSLLGYFEREPVVVFQEPPTGHKWVGVAGAGVPYAPAVTGFNDAGISISLHEMQTEEYRTHHGNRRGAIAGWAATKILEEASSIDEAWAIIQRTGHFGAWTFFVSDAKSNESASIEFTGKRMAITRRTRDGALGQSNHFLSPAMEGANYEYSYNKTLESRARLALVTDDLAKARGEVDVQWMIDELAGHRDHFVGLRSFGRTVTKGYTTMSHVTVPGRGEFWTSMGDTYPVTSGVYAGVKVNWDASQTGAAPLEILGTRRARQSELAGRENFRQSLYHYTLAYLNYRDHAAAGTDFVKSHANLTQAMELASRDGIFEFPYAFMRARIGIMAGAAKEAPQPPYLAAAIDDLLAIIDHARQTPERFHDYEVGLAYMWLGRAIDLLPPAAFRDLSARRGLLPAESYYAKARDIHAEVARNETKPYFLYRVMDGYMNRETGEFRHYTGKDPVADAIDFVTVE